MKRFIAGVAVGMVLAGGVAYAQQSTTSGQDFLNSWTDTWRLMYAFGWHSGFNSAANGLEFPSTVRQAQRCINNWTFGQTQAVIENYLRNNPAEWHENIAILSLRAVLRTCPL